MGPNAKKFIIINGPMGVGKSYICKQLNHKLINSVWLDGDWCMMMNPWSLLAENIEMFLDNTIYLLKNFLSNPAFNYVIYSWLFPREDLLNFVIKQVHDGSHELIKISLLCSNDKLKERMRIAGRDPNSIEKSLVYQEAIRTMDTIKVDTTDLREEDAIEEVLKLIVPFE